MKILGLPSLIGDRLAIDDNGCWLWTGATKPNGYGHIRIQQRSHYVHRVVYVCLVGDVPAGLELDHLCRVVRCANPDHLEPVTHSENVRRGTAWHGIAETQRAKTHCSKGHPYSGDNVYYRPNGAGRTCRACSRANQARYDRERRQRAS